MDYHTDLTLSHVEQMAAQAVLMNGQPQFSNQAVADVINTLMEAIAYEHIHNGSDQVLVILERALTMALIRKGVLTEDQVLQTVLQAVGDL